MADRSLLRSRAHEPTGEVESLKGKTDIGRMGDRVADQKTSRPSELQEKVQRKKHKRGDPQEGRKKENLVIASGGQTILDFDNLTGYQPTTQTARAAYETLLVRISKNNDDSKVDLFHLTTFVLAPLSF
jgi:pre-mRNA-splicing helicase BRR2